MLSYPLLHEPYVRGRREEAQASAAPHTVGPYDAYSAVHVNSKVDLVENDGMLRRISKVYVAHLNDWSRELGHVGKLQFDLVLARPCNEFLGYGCLVTGSNCLVLLFLCGSRFTFAGIPHHGFFGFGPTLARFFEFSQALFLLFPSLDLLLELGMLCLLEIVVVALVRDEFQVFDVQNFLADCVEEVLIVRHYEQSLFPFLQVFVEPDHRV